MIDEYFENLNNQINMLFHQIQDLENKSILNEEDLAELERLRQQREELEKQWRDVRSGF